MIRHEKGGKMLEKIHLFEARSEGYFTYRIPGILCTHRGVVLATVEARRGSGGDWDGNDVVIRRSEDGGRTWTPMQVLLSYDDYGEGPVSNFVMIKDASDQSVHALFCHNYARVFYVHSDNDGITWSDPREVTDAFTPFRSNYPWRVIATGPGHGIQLKNGRLLVPIWMSDGTGTEFGPGKLGHRPSTVAGVYSDDHGRTWQCGDIIVRTEGDIINPSETLPLELDDGRVLFNIRTEALQHRRLISISPDGATGWSDPRFDEALLEPVCMASILKLQNGEVVFVNPDNMEHEFTRPERASCDRKRLTVKMSLDDCQTWPVSKVLEPGQSSYSDLAQTLDGTILCMYEDQMVTRQNDTKFVTVARFDLDWLKG
jgi:sialidase-1